MSCNLNLLSKVYLSCSPFPNKSFENTEGKGEIDGNEQFLLFPQCFLPSQITFCDFLQIQNCCLQTLSLEESKIGRLGKVKFLEGFKSKYQWTLHVY